jgi:UDP-N-acetylmuramoyl-tripeptide--D-alanyl-D-alanine ligase
VRASDIQGRGLDGVSFTLHWRDESRRVRLMLPGRALVTNALAAAAVGLTEGMSLAEAGDALEQADVDVRLHAVRGKNGAMILDDTYNAGPASMAAALDLLGELPGRRIAVLGDMRELGSLEADAHAAIGRQAAGVADVIYTTGDLGELITKAAQAAGHENARHIADKEALGAALAQELRAGDVVLLKASRALALETLLEGLAE